VKKIALFKDMSYSFSSEHVAEETMEGYEKYVRVSEYVEVEFTLLPEQTVVENQLATLDSVEADLREKFREQLGNIEARRQNLRALTYKANAP